MAANTKTWIGGATARAQVDTVTPGTVEVGDVFTMTLTDEKGQAHSISFTATVATVANVTAGIAAAAAASYNQEWAKVTVADATTAVTVTADTAGTPFYLTVTDADGGGNDTQTFSLAHTTTSKGPYDYNCIDNWLEGAAPLTDTTVNIEGSNNVTYGLHTASVSTGNDNALTLQESIALAAFNIVEGCTANVGSTFAYLHIDSDSVSLKGSGVVWLHVDNLNGTLLVEQSASGAGDGTYGANLRCDEGAQTTAIVCNLASNATVGINASSGGTAADDGDATSVTVYGGEAHLGVHEIPTITQDGSAKVYNDSNITTLNQNSGTFYNQSAATITTANVLAGTFVGNSTGTITTLNVKGTGIADFSQDQQTKTITNINLYGRAAFKDPNGVVTATNGFDLHDANLDDITLDLAPNKTWTQSAI